MVLASRRSSSSRRPPAPISSVIVPKLELVHPVVDRFDSVQLVLLAFCISYWWNADISVRFQVSVLWGMTPIHSPYGRVLIRLRVFPIIHWGFKEPRWTSVARWAIEYRASWLMDWLQPLARNRSDCPAQFRLLKFLRQLSNSTECPTAMPPTVRIAEPDRSTTSNQLEKRVFFTLL